MAGCNGEQVCEGDRAVDAPDATAAVEQQQQQDAGLDGWIQWRPDPSSGTSLRRTLLMRAAHEGSLPVLKLLLQAGADVNLASPDDGVTALHAAASCTDVSCALEAISLLLSFGANREQADALGRRPRDYWAGLASGLTSQLGAANENSIASKAVAEQGDQQQPAPEMAPVHADEPTSSTDAASASVEPTKANTIEPVDMLSADFRMHRFKIEECPYTDMLHDHDWTECPFAHPGEKARRRDPRKYTYSSTTCPDFRKGSCKRGEMCPYAHGVFECWLHPSKYRTQLCKEAGACSRSVCWFAHSISEMRLPPGGPAQPPLSSSASLGNLQTEDQWNLLSTSHPENTRSSISSSGTTALLASSAAGSLLPFGSDSWMEGVHTLEAASMSESLTGLMDQMQIKQHSPATAIPLNPTFGPNKSANALFTPPVSPGPCPPKGARNMSSPGMTPSYLPASPQNEMSPSRQNHSRPLVRGSARSMTQQSSRMMPAMGLQQDRATALAQFLPQMLPVDHQSAMMRQGRQQNQAQRQNQNPRQHVQQQHQQHQQHQQFFHTVNPGPTRALGLSSRSSVLPQAPPPNHLLSHSPLLWSDAACEQPMLDLNSLAQLANLFAGAPEAMAAAWGPVLDTSAMFSEPPDAARAATMPAGNWGRGLAVDPSLVAGMGRPRSVTLPSGLWPRQEPAMMHHDSFLGQRETVQQQPSYFGLHQQ